MTSRTGAWHAKSGGPIPTGGLLAKAAEEIKRAAFKGLSDGADLVLETSQQRVPVLSEADQSKGRVSGELKAGAHTIPDEADGRVAIKYEGPYAAYIHEHMDFKHPNGGQAKYLESALNEKRDQVIQMVADEIRSKTGG